MARLTFDNIWKKLFEDKSAWLLALVNLMSVYLLVSGRMSFDSIFWAWYLQSIFIGIVSLIRILCLQNYTAEGVSIAGFPDSPPPGLKLKIYSAFFFTLVFGGFHFIYLAFIEGVFRFKMPPFSEIALLAGSFFLTHTFSFFYNKKFDGKGVNIGVVFFIPFVRIFPTHFFMIFGALIILLFPGAAIFAHILFILMKTLADLGMHALENHELVISRDIKTDLQKPKENETD